MAGKRVEVARQVSAAEVASVWAALRIEDPDRATIGLAEAVLDYVAARDMLAVQLEKGVERADGSRLTGSATGDGFDLTVSFHPAHVARMGDPDGASHVVPLRKPVRLPEED